MIATSEAAELEEQGALELGHRRKCIAGDGLSGGGGWKHAARARSRGGNAGPPPPAQRRARRCAPARRRSSRRAVARRACEGHGVAAELLRLRPDTRGGPRDRRAGRRSGITASGRSGSGAGECVEQRGGDGGAIDAHDVRSSITESRKGVREARAIGQPTRRRRQTTEAITGQ